MNNLTLLEFKNQRILTSEQLAEVYNTEPIRIRQAFNRNLDKFDKGKHYFFLEGEELQNFKSKYLNDTNLKFASKLILWTERGASRHCKILDTDKAWEQFDNLEETYFRAKKQTQVPGSIEDLIIMQAQSVKELKEKVESNQSQLQNIKNTIIHTDEDWRNWINSQFTKMCKENEDYREKKKLSYDRLENRAHCRLDIRLNNLRERLINVGATKTAANNARKLDIIESDIKLKEIYTTIVKEMAIKYS